MDSVAGTVAVLTGAGSGIGRATAHSLARRGATVLISDMDAERAQLVPGEIQALGGRAEGKRCDVSRPRGRSRLGRDSVARDYRRIDIIMSNVGVIAKGDPLEIPMDAWSSIIDVNLLGTVRVIHAFLPALIEQGSGHVVTTGSTAGLFSLCL